MSAVDARPEPTVEMWQRAREAHLADCPDCHDSYRAVVMAGRWDPFDFIRLRAHAYAAQHAHTLARLAEPDAAMVAARAFIESWRGTFPPGDEDDIPPAELNRYATEYGLGGFEDRLDGIRRNLPDLLK